jgi:beta-lactamase class A
LHQFSALNGDTLAALAVQAGLGPASIVVRGLDGGPDAAFGRDRLIYPASMIKVPIAASLVQRLLAGSIRPDAEVVVSAANMTPNDAPSPFEPGYRTHPGELMRAMLSASDNVATNELIDLIGRDRITADCRALGLSSTYVRRKLSGSLPLLDDPQATGRNVHPAGDAAALFERVARDFDGVFGDVRAALDAQIWNDKLAAGWTTGDAFAHKTGDTDEVSHDGGILTLPGGKRFVVVVYTELPSNPEADARLREFASALRPYLSPLSSRAEGA